METGKLAAMAATFIAAVALTSVAAAQGAGGGTGGSGAGSSGAGTGSSGAGAAGMSGGGATPSGGSTGVTGPSDIKTPGRETERYQHGIGEKARSMEQQLQDMDRQQKIQGESLPSPGDASSGGTATRPEGILPDKPLSDVEKSVDELEKR